VIVRILEVVGGTEHPPLVRFDAKAGRAAALWNSEVVPPKVGKEYSAELDVNLVLSSDARAAHGGVESLSESGDSVQIGATVEGIDSDGLLYLRISEDCLVMVESSGQFAVGDSVRFSCNATDLCLSAQEGTWLS
jgi:hypothetical protein